MKGKSVTDLFSLENRVAIITGGGGMLGYQHAAAIAGLGGIPVLLDISRAGLDKNKALLQRDFGIDALVIETDITSLEAIVEAKRLVLDKHNRIDILINNAANNPKVEAGGVNFASREFSARAMAAGYRRRARRCVQLREGVRRPHGRHRPGRRHPQHRVRPERHRAGSTPLPGRRPRARAAAGEAGHVLGRQARPGRADQVPRDVLVRPGRALQRAVPGGIYAGQNDVFVSQLVKLIPMGRMANNDEYCGAVAFLCSDASAYMNGVNLVVDGGRSVW